MGGGVPRVRPLAFAAPLAAAPKRRNGPVDRGHESSSVARKRSQSTKRRRPIIRHLANPSSSDLSAEGANAILPGPGRNLCPTALVAQSARLRFPIHSASCLLSQSSRRGACPRIIANPLRASSNVSGKPRGGPTRNSVPWSVKKRMGPRGGGRHAGLGPPLTLSYIP